MKVNHKQLKQLVKTAYERRTPLFIWGSMGIGKSKSLKDTAKEISQDMKIEFLEGEADGKEAFSFIDVRVSQLEPSDLRGIPVVDNGTTKWLIPNWLPTNKDSRGILFFDELNLAPPSIQASAYQLILDRRIGDYKLPDGWVIVSAGNTSEDRANVFELPAPLSNRFIHAELSIPTKEEWVKWALNNNIDMDICGFLENHPSQLYAFNSKNKSHAFPTPRMWEYVSRLIKDNKCSDDEREVLVCSAVGEGTGQEFLAFSRLKNKINLKDILDNPESVKSILELDLKYSLISAISEKYRENKKTLPNIFKVCESLEGEFAILLFKYLKEIGKSDFEKVVLADKVGKSLLNKYAKFLTDLKD